MSRFTARDSRAFDGIARLRSWERDNFNDTIS